MERRYWKYPQVVNCRWENYVMTMWPRVWVELICGDVILKSLWSSLCRSKNNGKRNVHDFQSWLIRLREDDWTVVHSHLNSAKQSQLTGYGNSSQARGHRIVCASDRTKGNRFLTLSGERIFHNRSMPNAVTCALILIESWAANFCSYKANTHGNRHI